MPLLDLSHVPRWKRVSVVAGLMLLATGIAASIIVGVALASSSGAIPSAVGGALGLVAVEAWRA